MSFRIAINDRANDRPRWMWATENDRPYECDDRSAAEGNAADLVEHWRNYYQTEIESRIVEGPPFALPIIPRALPEPREPEQKPVKIPLIRETVVVGAAQRDWQLDLVTSGEPPEFKWDDIQSGAARKFYDDQATKIVDALQKTLPGGTVDAVLAELMHRKASVFRVPVYEMPAAKQESPS